MKITLVGRPGAIMQQGTTFITTMLSSTPPALPNDLPEVPDGAVPYTILMASRQWAKVADTLQNPNARLIVDGFCAYDPQYKGLVVFAQALAARIYVPKFPTI